MKLIDKQAIKRTPLYHPLRNLLVRNRQSRELKAWESNQYIGSPPHIVKQGILLDYAKRFKLDLFVETGTLYGDMVYAMLNHFKYIYSIELSVPLYKMALERFKKSPHVRIIQGDSGKVLKEIVHTISQPALFWLDGHYSKGETAKGEKETPVIEELHNIFDGSCKEHVILIDDADLFGTNPAYPSIQELESLIEFRTKGMNLFVKDNIIRIIPAS